MPLEIQVISIYQSDSPTTEVHWEYYTSFDEDDFVRQYEYKSLDYHCNRPCQGFKQVKKCMIYEKEYDSIYCLIFKLPFEYKTERCNDHCVLSWTTRYQQTCSVRCGDGYKRVLYECTKSSSSMESIDEDICRKYVGEKPKDIVPCIGDCTGIGWVYGNWSEVCILFNFFRDWIVIFYIRSVIMMEIVYVNVQSTVETHRIYQYHLIIVIPNLNLILNDVLN